MLFYQLFVDIMDINEQAKPEREGETTHGRKSYL